MKTMESFAVACIGIFMLYWGFASDNGAVDCGSQTMSPGQQCTTLRVRGSSSSSHTRNYMEQREQNHRERLFVGVVGGIMLLLGAGVIIDRARSRRKSEKNSDQEYIYQPNEGVNCPRSRRVGDRHVRIPSAQDPLDLSAMNANASEGFEGEFKNVFFNRTYADRERIIAHWMRAKAVSRNDAMKLAVEDWRNDQSRH
jgi:hypothetical protein